MKYDPCSTNHQGVAELGHVYLDETLHDRYPNPSKRAPIDLALRKAVNLFQSPIIVRATVEIEI
jgi:hypothetical protein